VFCITVPQLAYTTGKPASKGSTVLGHPWLTAKRERSKEKPSAEGEPPAGGKGEGGEQKTKAESHLPAFPSERPIEMCKTLTSFTQSNRPLLTPTTPPTFCL